MELENNMTFTKQDLQRLIDKKLTDEEMEKIAGTKHFNCILMNPPYGNLHLKFLEKTNKICDKVVSIQPVRWINDPNAKFNKKSDLNKYEESICKHIKDLEIIPDKEAEKLMGAAFNMDIGIFNCDKNGGYNYKLLSEDKIFDSVVSNLKDNIKNHIEYSKPENAIVVSMITGGNNGRKSNIIDLFYTFSDYNRFIYDKDGKRLDNGLTFYENRKKTAWGNVSVKAESSNIKFDTTEQCINFFNFTRLDLFRYIFNKSVVDVHVHPEKLPFIGDYKHEWTNKELFDYFDISKEDRDYISNYVKEQYEALKNRVEEENKNKKRRKSK